MSAPARRDDDRRLWWTIALATLAGLVARLAFRIDYAEEVDSIRFLLALDDFDVAAHRPHAPGYPVFIMLGRACYALTGDPTTALALLCAVCGAALTIPVALLARNTVGARAAQWAAVLVAVNPLLWLFSDKLLSDMPGLLFLCSALAALSYADTEDPRRRRRALALGFLLLGLMLGVRLSYFPFAAAAFALAAWRTRAVLLPIAAGTIGVLSWFVPFLLDTGWHDLLHTIGVQGSGHFERWGGTVITHDGYGHRAAMLAWEVGAQGLGAWWADRSWLYLLPTLAIVALAGLALRRGAREALPRLAAFAVLVVPYGAWAFLGQNITVKARHALPLVVFAVLALAVAIARATARRLPGERWQPRLAALCAVVVIAGHTVSGAHLAAEHRDVPSNAVRLAQEMQRQCVAAPGRPVVLYTSSLQRHLERHAPCVEVVVLRRAAQVARDLAGRPAGTLAFVASDVARLERLQLELVLHVERNRYIQNARSQLSLYRIEDRHAGRAQGGQS